MFMAACRNLMILLVTVAVVGISIAVWPIDDPRPERQLTDAGARLAYAFDGTVIVGASLEGLNFGDEHVALAATIPTMQRLSLAESFVTQRGIKSLRSLPRLAHLSLRQTRWTHEAVDEIVQLSTLKELSLDGCEWLRDEHVDQLSALPNLEQLNLSSTFITQVALQHLERFPALKFLLLNHCSQIDDSVIESLISLCRKRPMRLSLSWTEITRPGLSRLRENLPGVYVDLRPESMAGLRDVGERGQFTTDRMGEIVGFRFRREMDGWVHELQTGDLAIISSVPGLKRLNLDHTNITDEMLLETNRIPQLEVLHLSSTRVSDAGLQVLCRFPNLSAFVITNADLKGHGLENLRHVPHLQTLRVQSQLGDEIIPYITSLSNLRVLSVHAPLTDAGMQQLSQLANLQSLELIQTQVRGAGVEKLVELRSLHELVFFGGLLDDSDVAALAQLKKVNQITLSRTQMSRAGRNRLASLVPSTGVLWTDFEISPRDAYR